MCAAVKNAQSNIVFLKKELATKVIIVYNQKVLTVCRGHI